jgi:hypothetical protein
MPDQPSWPQYNAAVSAAALALAALLAFASCGAALGGDSDVEANCSAQRHGDAAAAVPPPPPPPVQGGGDAGREGQQDDSVRCRLSGICEGGHPGCPQQAADAANVGDGEGAPDPLACLTSAAARAEAVQEAARHAWQGYRCALPACVQLQATFVRPPACSPARLPDCRIWRSNHPVGALPTLLHPPCCCHSASLDAAPAPPPAHHRRPGLWPPACRDCAWGEDELRPLSCTGVHWLNLSLTVVDSLDTLYLLDMRREFEEAAE